MLWQCLNCGCLFHLFWNPLQPSKLSSRTSESMIFTVPANLKMTPLGCHFDVILKQEILTILTLGSSCTSLGPLLHAFSSPSLLWQSPWEHFGASEATLASPAAPFGAKTPPKVTLKWTSEGNHTEKATIAKRPHMQGFKAL